VKVLDRLVERGDTLVIVEHHPDVIANADWVVELGPEAGDSGGTVVFEGEPKQLEKKKTATGRAMSAIAAAAAVSPRPRNSVTPEA
jgi:excinuclease ABC subunit A